jgi:hypothetical protein
MAEKIRFTVVTTADDLEDEFNVHSPLRGVFQRALVLVGGQGQPEQFTLEYSDQALTDLDRKIEDYAKDLGWGTEVELELVPAPVVI